MDNKFCIKVADISKERFDSTSPNDIIMYSTLSNQAVHIGIGDTSNYITFDNDNINIQNSVLINNDIKVIGQILDQNGNPYTSGSLSSNSVITSLIDDNAITNVKIDTGAINARTLEDNSVTSSKITSNAIKDYHLDNDILKAHNIVPGTFSNAKFTFVNNLGINRLDPEHSLDIKGSFFAGNTLRDKYVKLNENGNPYIIDIKHDDYDGRFFNFTNDVCTRGNTEDSSYAMISVLMPNLAPGNNFQRIKIGKTFDRCFELDYTPCNQYNQDVMALSIKKANAKINTMYVSTSGIGINNPNPKYTLDVIGSVNVTGSFSFGGSNIGVQGNNIGFENSNITMIPKKNFIVDTKESFIVRNPDTPTPPYIICNSNGQIGIMNENPAYTLDVNGDVNVTNSLNVNSSLTSSNIICNTLSVDNSNFLYSNNHINLNAVVTATISPSVSTNSTDVFHSSLSALHDASWSHFSASVDSNSVFEVKRDGFMICKNLSVDCNIGIGVSDAQHKLDVDGNINSTGIIYGNGSGITHLNGNNVTSGVIPYFHIDDLPASKITSGTMVANRIYGGVLGIANGNNLIDLNAANINGILNGAVKFSTNVDISSADSVFRIRFDQNSHTHIKSGSNLYLNNSNTMVDVNGHVVAPTIRATSFIGDGFGITNLNAAELSGDLGTLFRFPIDNWIKSFDEEDRFYFNSNTYITAPNRIVFGDSNEHIYIESNQIYVNATQQDMSCITAINYATNQNLSDQFNAIKGSISIQHPNDTNDIVRALTISRQDVVTAYITSHGNIYGEGSYFTSDERLKTDRKSLTCGMSVLNRLNAEEYTKWNNFDHTGVFKKEAGFIAQDVYKNIPELRHLIQMNGHDEKVHLNYTGIIPYIVQSLQEKDAQIKELKDIVLELRNYISSL